MAKLLPGIDGYIAGVDHINRDELAVADCLRIIVRYGVGIDRVDLAAASEKGIILSNTLGATASSEAVSVSIRNLRIENPHSPNCVAGYGCLYKPFLKMLFNGLAMTRQRGFCGWWLTQRGRSDWNGGPTIGRGKVRSNM